jgi:anti-sigma B factor antagonist
MKIKIRYIDDIVVVEVEGKININSSKLIETIGSILTEGMRNIVIDMEGVDFIDYNGLSVLAIAYKSAINNKAVMKLCGVSSHILELLRVVRLDEVFDIYNNMEDALGSFKQTQEASKESILEQPLRRRFQRLGIDMPVNYRLSKVSSHKGEAHLYSARIANISGAGIFIRTINVLPPGSEVEVEIKLISSMKPKHLKGIVMWLPDKGLQPDLYPGMGVQFTGLSQHAQEEIIEFIEKHTVHRKG